MKNNELRAKLAIVFVTLILILDFISLLFDYLEYQLLSNVFTEDSFIEAENSDLRQLILGILYMIVYSISVVMFIRWFRRAYFNLHTKVDILSYTEGWAAGSWFVPIISLYRPFKIMKELYAETIDYLSDEMKNFNIQFNSVYIIIWWSLWILSNILGRMYFKQVMKAETIDQLLESTRFSMINTAISIPLALITIKVIYDYSKIENILFNFKKETETTENQLIAIETEDIKF